MSAREYTFQNIADTNGPYLSFGSPSINDAGVVVFTAVRGNGNRMAIYTFSGGGLNLIVDNPLPLSQSVYSPVPAINNSGVIAYTIVEQSVASLRTVSSGQNKVLYDSTGEFTGFGLVSINNQGRVAFTANLRNGDGQAFITDGTSYEVIARRSDLTNISPYIPHISINDSAALAMVDAVPPFEGKVLLASNGNITAVWSLTEIGPQTSYWSVGLNNQGDLVAAAFQTSGNSSILRRSAGQISRVVVQSMVPSFYFFSEPAINDSGDIAFTALYNFGSGLFTGPDPTRDKVIARGDTLFGAALKAVGNAPGAVPVSSRYLNNSGQIVFGYELENGIRGIALATPVGQPPALTAGSVANGATYGPGLVPGSWAQVKGTNLAATTRIWQGSDFTSGNNLPTSLDGVEVKVNGLPAAVYFISPTQISFQVPAGVSGTVTVQAIRNGVASTKITAQAVESSPGLFGYAVGAKTYPAAVYANTTIVVGDPAVSGSAVRKAIPGDRVALYATAIAPSPAGVIVGVSGVSGVTATIGTTPATVEFAGLVAVGQFQINIVVPNLPPGEYPLVIRYNGKDSQAGISFPVGP